MAMGECSAYSSLQAGSKVKFAAWSMSLRPPGADRLSPRGPKENSRMWLRAVNDNTINIVWCIIIIIIIIIFIRGNVWILYIRCYCPVPV